MFTSHNTLWVIFFAKCARINELKREGAKSTYKTREACVCGMLGLLNEAEGQGTSYRHLGRGGDTPERENKRIHSPRHEKTGGCMHALST